MTDDAGLVLFQRIHSSADIVANGDEVIGIGITRRTALPVTAHFRNQYAITGSNQRRDLLAPGMPALGKAVQQP